MKVTYHYFLGLQTLDILAETIRLIQENDGIKINLDYIPLNDKYTFETIFQPGNTGKVFQFESAGMQKLLKRMKPTCMADLCAANAAYRPGPMQFIDEFIEGRNNPENVRYPTKEYETIAKETKGILFYQEQIMQLVQSMAGFTLGEADVLRRGIGKKEKKYIDEGRELFVKGCLKLGTADEKTAKYIYSTIEKFANYGFNKSHSDAYGLVAYLCGYLKAHYPECFMAANLTITSHDVKKLAYTLSETKKIGIEILPPDVRFSKEKFTLEVVNGRKAIRFSLAAIKSIREENAELFTKADNSSLYSFLKSIPSSSLRKNQITNLIYSGAFDYLGKRKDLCTNLDKILEVAKTVNSFKQAHIPTILSNINPVLVRNGYEFQQLDKLKKEKDCIQIALSGHPVSVVRNMAKITHTLADLQTTDIIEDKFSDNSDEIVEIIGLITNVKDITTKKGDQMSFCNIEDEFTTIDGVLFPKDYMKLHEILMETQETPVLIKGKLKKNSTDNGETSSSLIINSIEKILKNTYSIYLDSFNVTDELLNTISKINGVASVLLVDSRKMTVEKLPFCVDANHDLIALLKQNHIKYKIKK